MELWLWKVPLIPALAVWMSLVSVLTSPYHQGREIRPCGLLRPTAWLPTAGW